MQEQALKVWQSVVDDFPAVTLYRNNLAFGLNGYGTLLASAGRKADAIAAYRRAKALYEPLVQANPGGVYSRRGLARSHGEIGWLLREEGRSAEALSELVSAAALFRALLQAEPASTVYQEGLGRNLNNIGVLGLMDGRAAEALAAHEQARAVWKSLTELHPRDLNARENLAFSETLVASALVVLRRPGAEREARAACDRAIAIREDLIRDAPAMVFFHQILADTLLQRGRVRRMEGDLPGATLDVRRALTIFAQHPSEGNDAVVREAFCHAALSDLARADGSGVSAAEGATAMALLRRAVASGFRDVSALRSPDLDPLRARADFQLLMLDLTFPDDPFAR